MSSPANANKPVSVTLWADRINQAYNGELGDEAGRKARDRINWMCAQAQGDSVLDIGCSQGITTLLLAREGFKTVGIDISEDAIAYACAEQEKELPSVRERIEFRCTDLAGLDAGELFDTVILGEVLEHQAHTARFLKTAAAHVNAGGTLVVTVPFGLHPFPDHKATVFPRDLIEILAAEFSVTTLDVQDGYIRFAGTKGGKADAAVMELAAELTEAGSFHVQQKYFDLQARNTAAAKKNIEFKKSLDERTRELGALASRCNVLEREHDGLQERISHLETALKTAAEVRTSIEQDHMQRLERLQGDLATAVGQRNELEARLSAAQESQHTQQNERMAQITALQVELAQAMAQRKGIEMMLATTQQSNAALESVNAARLAGLQAELGQTTGRRRELEAELAAARKAQIALEKDNAARVADLQAQLTRAAGQRDELQAALEAAQQSLITHEQDYGARTAALQAELAMVSGQRDELGAALTAVQQAQVALKDDNAARMADLQAELEEAIGKRDELETALDAAQQAQVVLERDNAERMSKLQDELAHGVAQRNALESELASERQSSIERDKQNTARATRLQAELKRATQQCGELESKLVQVRAAEVAAQNLRATEVSRLKAELAALEHRTAQARAAEAHAQAARIAALERRIERNAELMARKQAALEMSAMAVRKTLSFQLGNLLINGFKSPRSLVKLPGALLALRAEAKSRRQTRRNKDEGTASGEAKGEVSGDEFEQLLSKFNSGGVEAVSAFLAERDMKPHAEAAAFTQLGRHLQTIFPEKAAEAAREAYVRDPQPFRAKWLAFRLFDAGALVEPATLLAALPGTSAELSVSEQRRADEIAALARLHAAFPEPELAASPVYPPVPGTLLYVAASSLPYHTTGYTVRTHELVKAIAAAGVDVRVLTRPGYPWDRADRKGAPQSEQTVLEQILYLHRQNPSQVLPLDIYFEEAARAIAAVAKEQGVASIHAASNHVNALPALLAARSLGIPFVYEMRGLWELSRASKVPNYETSERFQLGLDLEAFVAKNADRVYVISTALGQLIQGWGVDPQRVAVLPNCVNEDTIEKTEKRRVAKITDVFTVGYAGAMVGYEGLDVLIEAIAHLKARGLRVNARLIGDGDIRAALEALAAERGLGDQVSFLGKLPPEQARAQLVATNAVAIPRKPHHVCEIIPPIKLVEAMALGLPVVVPNLPVFCEEVRSEETGILFKAGDAVELANALERLAQNPQQAAEMGERARQHAGKARVWRVFAEQIKNDMSALTESALTPASTAAIGTAPALAASPVAAEAPAVNEELDAMIEAFDRGGVAAVSELLAAKKSKPRAMAAAFTELARYLHPVSPVKASLAAREAYELDPQPNRAKLLAFRLFDAGQIEESMQLLTGPAASSLTPSEQRRAEQVAAHARLRAAFPALPDARPRAYDARPGSLLYVAASSLPYHTSGYTVRTHELVRAVASSGVDVTVLTRPGYPWDRADRTGEPEDGVTVIDNIVYLHRESPAQSLPLDVYFQEAARTIAEVASKERVFAIHAASNHVNALPALLAARSLGIPFVYEMRGLWELSRSSKVDGYDTSERFQLGLDLEAFVAKNADRVYAISNALGQIIQGWGVDPQRVAVLPNCINEDTISKAEEHQAVKIKDVFTVGYAGAMVGYEGLDVLIGAIAHLKGRGLRVNARLIGDGDIRAELEELVVERGLSDQVSFLGKLPPEQARAQLAAANAVAIPRKPYQVCEIIPPIKLVEAMALGLPVVVPNLPVFCEEVRSEETGILFKAGDAVELANALERLAQNPQQAAEMGERARQHAGKARVWRVFAKQIKADLDAVRYTELYRANGVEAVVAQVKDSFVGRHKQAASELLRAGRLLGEYGHADVEYPLAKAALELDRSESVLRGAFWISQRALDFELSCNIISQLEQIVGDNPSEQQAALLAKMRTAPAYLLTVLREAKPQHGARLDSIPGRLCYVLHNTLPYSSGGYATRSHGVATGIARAGWDVVVLSRPGFPLDIKPELTEADVTPVDVVDGIPYVRTLAPLRSGQSAREYLLAAADAMEVRLREYRPSIVIAASNHMTSLPALIAARRLGLPFIYEVRGLWEITRLSRDTGFSETAAFHVQRMLESAVAETADHVFTLTEPMREELVERGVPYSHVDLLPNSCDPERFVPVPRNEALAASLGIPAGVPVIGYIGTFVDYEGLENLAEACALLKQRGIEFRLLMVGNENASGQTRGPITEEIVRIATEGGFADWLIMTGRVPHEEVEGYYSLVDIAPFPRRPLPVCEMVSPMKPLEALAMEKAVVVSSVRALVEMVQDGKTGLVFEKGSTESLAATLQRLIDSPDLRTELGVQGRQWVQAERTWAQIGEKAGVVLTHIVDQRKTGAA